MSQEARTDGLRTFREYAQLSGVSYEAVRKKVEACKTAYEKAQALYAYTKNQLERDPDNENLKIKFDAVSNDMETRRKVAEGVVTIGNTKYLTEAAQAYLDQQREGRVIVQPDNHAKEALAVVQSEAEALRKRVIDLQETVLKSQTAELEDLKENGSAERIRELEALVEKQGERINLLTEDNGRILRELEANKADFKALTERLDNLYTEVLKSRKKGLFGRYKE